MYLSSSTPKLPTFTKTTCLLLLQNCKSIEQLKEIHCQIFRTGLHRSKGAQNKLMLCCTDPEFGNLHYAEKVFQNIRDPHLFIYNLVIKAFTKNGSFRKTVGLFIRLREDGLSPDNFTYPFVLKAMGCLRSIPEGRKTHGFIIKAGFEFDCYVRIPLMDMYAEMGLVELSMKLFDEMSEKDVMAWNVLINGLVKCQQFNAAVELFRRMEKEDVKPDEATLVSTLSACVSLGDLELGKQIHRYVIEELGFSIVLDNALLDMYAKCGSINEARRLFDQMPAKNVISWTSMVSGYGKCGNLDEARQLFERNPSKDVILWTAMINVYVQYSCFEEALALLREMQVRRIKLDKYTVASLLTACANSGALEQGKWIHHNYIGGNRIRADAVVGTALLDMYAKCGCIEKSLELFMKTEEKDAASWTAIICGLAMNGLTNKALQLFAEMNQVGAKPDAITFVGVLSACNHGGLVKEGCEYFDSMWKTYKIEPKLEHYACLVDLLGRAGFLDEAEKLMENIPNGKEVLPLWGALLGACRSHGNVEMGERLAARLTGIESCNSGIHTTMANIYAAADRWEDMTKMRRKMKDLGVKKIPGCSSIEVNCVVH